MRKFLHTYLGHFTRLEWTLLSILTLICALVVTLSHIHHA